MRRGDATARASYSKGNSKSMNGTACEAGDGVYIPAPDVLYIAAGCRVGGDVNIYANADITIHRYIRECRGTGVSERERE